MEELVFNNYLLLLKSTTEVYVHGTLESSNEKIRNILKEGLDKTLNNQANTYDKMLKNDWYTVENIDSETIKKCCDNLEN